MKKCENVLISIKCGFPKIAKIITQQKKTTVFYNRKNQFPKNAKNRRFAKINSRKNLVLRGN